MALKTDYKDDVLDTSVNTVRKYNMIQNDDGTVSFEDVTEYLQTGDSFGAQEMNDLVGRVLTFQNVSLAVGDWVESGRSDGWNYYADVVCDGVTTDYVPSVMFSLTDATSGNFAPYCSTQTNGYVRIFASETPSSTVTIPTIQCIKSV